MKSVAYKENYLKKDVQMLDEGHVAFDITGISFLKLVTL